MVNKIKKIELLYSKVKKKYYEDIFLNTYNDNKDDLSNEINKFISQYPEFKSYGNYL
jgi:hypothetical protein